MSNRGVCIAEAQRFCKVVVVARSAVVHDYVEHSSFAVPLNCSKPYTIQGRSKSQSSRSLRSIVAK